jgi:hypothetical protein
LKGDGEPALFRSPDGAEWTVGASPAKPDEEVTTASCFGEGECMVIVAERTTVGGSDYVFYSGDAGTTWIDRTPEDFDGELGMECGQSGTCVARDLNHTYVTSDGGERWAEARAPSVLQFDALECFDDKDVCIALGGTYHPQSAAVWETGSWHVDVLGNRFDTGLNSIDCVASHCVAVGSRDGGGVIFLGDLPRSP